jgi:hypothetical protein
MLNPQKTGCSEQELIPISADRAKLHRENFTRSTNSAISLTYNHHFKSKGGGVLMATKKAAKKPAKKAAKKK